MPRSFNNICCCYARLLLFTLATSHDVADFWKQVWPDTNFEAQHARQQQVEHLSQAANPWPTDSESPDLPPLTPEDFRKTFRQMQKKASGPDQWSARELCHLPDNILEDAIRLFTRIEVGEDWPTSLVSWKQVHLLNPHKEAGNLDSLRPLSIGSIWYHAWAHIRSQQVSHWVHNTMATYVHGGIRKRGVHTALLKLLAAIEAQQAYLQRHGCCSDTLPCFIGAADLSKAFDKLSADFATAALARMGLPTNLVYALSRAWGQQQRWLQLGNHVGREPLHNINVLPQGDPFSFLALNACIAEAAHRIATQFSSPCNMHAAYLDDRAWTSATATECVNIADAWSAETQPVQCQNHHGMAAKLKDPSAFSSAGCNVKAPDPLRALPVLGVAHWCPKPVPGWWRCELSSSSSFAGVVPAARQFVGPSLPQALVYDWDGGRFGWTIS
eukprot:Skav201261  [mRNA]  locus=scaffold4638:22592:24961:- [translate_table: standard]